MSELELIANIRAYTRSRTFPGLTNIGSTRDSVSTVRILAWSAVVIVSHF